MGLRDFFKKDKPAPAAPAKTPVKAKPGKSAPAKGAPAKPAAASSSGNARSAAVCGDGISIENFEKLSYAQWQKQAGNEKKTIQEWREAVVDSLENAKSGDSTLKYQGVNTITKEQADRFNSVAKSFQDAKGNTTYTSTAPLENLLTGKVKGLHQFGNVDTTGKWVNYYPQYRMRMWMYLKKKGLAYEGFWQHETKASFVNKGKTVYADPTEVPYLVSNVAPVGSFVKIKAPNGNTTYARILESGTEKAEVSLKTWWNLGYPNTTPASGAPASTLEVTSLGVGAFPKGSKAYDDYYMSSDEIQRAGKLLDDKKAKNIVSRKDLEAAEKANKPAEEAKPAEPKQASADPAVSAGGGGPRLEHGFSTVAIGNNMRLVGYACEDCLHEGGGHVMEGSATVYVGKYPFARLDDATSDGLAVVTGDETVFVGGPPTSALLV